MSNNNNDLFKLSTKSKFQFANPVELSEKSEDEESSMKQSLFLQQYFIRQPFSNLVRLPEKTNIEENYFSKLRTSLANC